MLQAGGGTEFNLHIAAARRLRDLQFESPRDEENYITELAETQSVTGGSINEVCFSVITGAGLITHIYSQESNYVAARSSCRLALEKNAGQLATQ